MSFQKNPDMRAKTWQLYISAVDMHVNGIGAATLSNTINEVDACAVLSI